MFRIAVLHKKVHGVSGMFGSLDCMHTQWKNCPVGWQGSFKGRAGYPSIVLEAACDYNCYFWHLDYGHAGTNNDVNVLQASDFYQSFLDGRMEEIERDVVPFTINNEVFKKMFVLTDGAYPQFDRFVKPQRFPILPEEHRFMDWQSACRKDIERAFGILQGQWQAIARPIQLHSIKDVAVMVKCCLCLHNMLVSDRVMNGDFQAPYDPTNAVYAPQEHVADVVVGHGTAIGLAQTRTINPLVYEAVTRGERFRHTTDKTHCLRLRQALINSFKSEF
jgi:Plant transposon protein